MSRAGHLGENLAALALGGTLLAPERRAELERHLDGCGECQRALAEAKKIFAALAEIPAVEPGAGFDRALREKLDAIDGAAEDTIWARFRRLLTVPNVAAAGFAAAAMAIAVVAIRGPQDPSEPPPEIAENVLLSGEGDEGLEIAENLELLRDLDVIEDLDVADDLEVISMVEGEGEPG
jgi:anti-sigma factor RsiW